MGTKSNPGAFDCYANAEPDEPMFILLGRDRHAPTLVWLWSMMRELDGEDLAKVAGARQDVEDMLRWQIDHGRKTIGIGHAAMVAVMALIRTTNSAVQHAKNNPTRDEALQRMLAVTLFENPDAGIDRGLEQSLGPAPAPKWGPPGYEMDDIDRELVGRLRSGRPADTADLEDAAGLLLKMLAPSVDESFGGTSP